MPGRQEQDLKKELEDWYDEDDDDVPSDDDDEGIFGQLFFTAEHGPQESIIVADSGITNQDSRNFSPLGVYENYPDPFDKRPAGIEDGQKKDPIKAAYGELYLCGIYAIKTVDRDKYEHDKKSGRRRVLDEPPAEIATGRYLNQCYM
eukprot:UN29984